MKKNRTGHHYKIRGALCLILVLVLVLITTRMSDVAIATDSNEAKKPVVVGTEKVTSSPSYANEVDETLSSLSENGMEEDSSANNVDNSQSGSKADVQAEIPENNEVLGLVEDSSLLMANISVSDEATLLAAVNNAPTDGSTYEIEITGQITLTGSITIEAGKNISIYSAADNTYTLTQNVNQIRHFILQGSSTSLTLSNIKLDGSNKGGGVEAKNDAVFTMNSGAIIENCYALYGGGVYIWATTFNMYGDSKISNNIAIASGGGIYIENNSGYTCTMTDTAKIIGNRTDSTISDEQTLSTNGSGAGMFLHNGGTFIMSGTAAISDNTGKSKDDLSHNGGGVCISEDVTFIMEDSAAITGNKASNGGGVYALDHVKFTMSGSSYIQECRAENNGGDLGWGGGISFGYDIDFTMKDDAKILNNTAGAGGGINANTNATGVVQITMEDRSIISNNQAGTFGGGVCLYPNTGTGVGTQIKMNMIGTSKIIENTAGNQGGGAYLRGISSISYSLLTLDGGSISKNKATSATGSGGGVYLVSAYCYLDIQKGSLADNTATNGGGVYLNNGNTTVKTITMSGGTVNNNKATNGGGVYLNGGTFDLSGGIVGSNNATTNGGGVYLATATANVMMSGGNIGESGKGNEAINGGGAYLNGGTFSLSDGTIGSNKAGENGGGIYLAAAAANIKMSGGNIGESDNGNESGSGGGVYLDKGKFSMTAGTIGYNKTTIGNGGGVYVSPDVAETLIIGMNDDICSIIGNTAPNGHGGGIYTTKSQGANGYSNLIVGKKAKFSGNSSLKYYAPPDKTIVDETPLWTTIDNYTSSQNSGSTDNRVEPVNNFDINVFTYRVTFYASDEHVPDTMNEDFSVFDSVQVAQYCKVEKPNSNPIYTGAVFVDWYAEEGLLNKYDFNKLIVNDTNIYAKMELVSTNSISFTKIDGNVFAKDGTVITLSGAEFALFQCMTPGKEEELVPIEVINGIGTSPDWQPVMVNPSGIGNEAYRATSDMNGVVIFQSLIDGAYVLVETKAPNVNGQQYDLPSGQWSIKIDSAQTPPIIKKAIADANGQYPPAFTTDNQLPNLQQHDLPMAGGIGTTPFILIGSLLLIMGILLLIIRQKRLI